jgi:Major tropism determinant N-terminal domain
MTTVIKLKRGLKVDWTTLNPILAAGEAGFEIDTGQVKVGDGVRAYNSLPYTGSGAAALQDHIDSLLPHPVYDDGPSLALLYENAKV